MGRRRLTIAESGGEVEDAGRILCILVEPDDRLARLVTLPTTPGQFGKHGPQIAPEALVAILGKRVEQRELLFDGQALLVTVPGAEGSWWLGLEGPFEGPGLIVGYDKQTDAYSDTRLSMDEVAEIVEFDEKQHADEEDHDGAVAGA